MFSRKSFDSLKRAAAVFLSVCMLVSLFTCLTVVTAYADGEPVVTETAVFIGATGDDRQAAMFIPVDIPNPTGDGNLFSGEEQFKVVFKCRMLSGSKPIVGVYSVDPVSSNKSYSQPTWCDNSAVTVEDGVCTAEITVDFTRRVNPNSEGNRSFYLMIGNSYYSGSETLDHDFDDAFIASDVKLFWYDSDAQEYCEEEEDNLLPAFTSGNINFKGTYFFKYDGCDNWDSPLGASAMQWHLLSTPSVIKKITVPADYNTADTYDAANFIQTAETDYTREYYTNENYEGLYFGKLKNSGDAGFEIISKDVNKKMVVIDANHEGEPDYNDHTGNEKAPQFNRAANIFLPISYGQYAMTGGTAQDISFLVKVTFKAVRLEGDSAPVIGRIVGKKGKSSGKGSQALCKAAYNVPPGDYASNPESYNETFKDSEGNRLKCEYNAETGDFTGWMRVRCADNDYSSRWGCNEVITIGNAEHVWAAGGKFDSTSFNSSFAISNIKVDLYECGTGYVCGEMIAEDIAPALTADTLDTTSRWAYQYRDDDGRDCSNNDYDCIRAPQNLWSAEGCVGMVHAENLTPCIKEAHTLTHNAATDTTREYWSCSCGKNYKESYAKTEITDLTAKNQMIYIAASENPASAFIPIKLNGFEGNRWFKFTCKAKLVGGDSIPVVSTLYSVYNGSNQCETTVPTSNDGDFAVFEYSYDPETCTLTAYIKAWIKDIINQKDRYPFERINPVSGANCAIVLGNGRYLGTGYTEQNTDTDFAFAEPELYMLDCTGGGSALETAKTAEAVSENIIAPMTDKTVDLEGEYVAVWTNSNNPVAAPVNTWYRTGSDKANVTVKNIPKNYFTPGYVECNHESTTVVPAVASTCCTQGHGEYTVCDNPDCQEILEGSDAALPLDPNNHEGETEVRGETDSTCTEAGYTGDTYCLGCGEKIAEGTAKPLAEHTVGEWVTDAENHWHVCSVCTGEVDKAAHSGGTATCHSKAVCTVCGAEYGEFDANNHDGGTQVRGAVEATCTEAGYTGDTYCLGCGEKIAEGKATEAAGHTADHWRVGKIATTEEDGLRYKICDVCGERFGDEVVPKIVMPVIEPGENVPEIVVESKTAAAGSTVDVKISLKNNPGIASMKLTVEYDEGLTLKAPVVYDIYPEEADPEMPQVIQPAEGGSPIILNWVSPLADVNGDMVYATLTFELSADAEGEQNITVTYNPNDIYNLAEENIGFAVTNGKITVGEASYIRGDINGDGEVDNKDLTRLFQYLSNWDVEVNEPALDVNGDSSVDNKDLTRLFQYLSNWDVEIF